MARMRIFLVALSVLAVGAVVFGPWDSGVAPSASVACAGPSASASASASNTAATATAGAVPPSCAIATGP